jgi:uncharacterized protein YndB with AHSA1/START domain
MDARPEGEATVVRGRTNVERTSDRELVVRRTFDAPAHIVFEAWTKPELFMRWWASPSPVPLLSCEMDVRTGGKYRLEFGHDASETWTFFGKYLEVTPPSRLVWTNDEAEEGAVTSVTFEETDGKTLLVLRDLYPSKEALDEAMASGSISGFAEQFEQLDEVLVTSGASASPS